MLIPSVKKMTFSRKCVWLCLIFLATTREKANSASLCPEGRYSKGNLYCVPDCGPGRYGNTQERTCQKCASNCKTCLNGESNNLCSSCHSRLFLKDKTCVEGCGDDRLNKGPPETHIKLVGGSSDFEGRVLINHDGVWGTVCDDSWDINDATVVCRELSLGYGKEAVKYGRLGRGNDSDPIWLSMLKCTGKENRLERCAHNGWGNHSCSHDEDAGVRCTGPDTTRECVAECGDGYYLKKGKRQCGACSSSCLTCEDSPDACTSCESSKFLRKKDKSCVTSCGIGFYGDTSNRQCKPCDRGCRTCGDGTSSTNCTSCPDNRFLNGSQCLVSCAPRLVGQKRRIRLEGANSTELQGRLEVFVKGSWSTVCRNTFDFREATVACRQLGLGGALKAVKNTATFGRGTGSVWSNELNCTGREQSLFDCPIGAASRCFHDRDVGVVCQGPIPKTLQTGQCLKRCKPGWFKNDVDVCDLCAAHCAECISRSYRCKKCKPPKFLIKENNTCVDKCADGEFGHVPTRECRKCNTDECMTCADGSDKDNCTSCKPPKALKDRKCQRGCGPNLYQKNGVCVKDCGDLFYKYIANYSCLPCPVNCLQCKFATNAPRCTVCAPPLVFESDDCVANCTGANFAVPIKNGSFPSTPLLRLTNGSDYFEGVLEILHDGVWGTVCDDGWDARETSVVCKELGLGTADTDTTLSHIKKISTGKQWLDDVFCTGTEKTFSECKHRPWGQTNCRPDENTVLRCTGPGVRICKNNCPDEFYAKGKVCLFCNSACKKCSGKPNNCSECSEGYYKKNGTCVAHCGRGYYLDGTCKTCNQTCGSCEGKPDNCTSCDAPRYKKGSSCVLDCSPLYSPSSKPQIRLVGNVDKSPLKGRIEILHAGQYGTVCDDHWDIRDANVVCNMLGMGNATAAVTRATFGQGDPTMPIWMDDVDCKGNETSITRCTFRGWGIENCAHNEDAGVICSRPGKARDCLKDCDTNNSFFEDLSHGSKVCGKCSDNCQTCYGNLENCTTCPPNYFLNSTGSANGTYNCAPSCLDGYFADHLSTKCMPCDKSCYNCEVKKDNCTACKGFLKEDKCVVKCPEGALTLQGVDGIRLVGANSTVEGRVEILHDGTWGTICDDNFDINDAHVVCRQLKLGKAVEARTRAKYGQGTGKIWIDDLQCIGVEKNVKDCRMNSGGIGKHNCRHTEDAGVKCSGPDMSKRCVTSCGDGFFKTPGKKCERCLLKCKTCKDKADSCTSCDFPFFYANSSSDCVTKCPPGFYGNTKERLCKPCDNVCLTCSNGETGDQCQSCPKGLFLNGSSCVNDCGDLSSVSSLFPSKPSEPVVRLAGGASPNEGRVEVFYDGIWGTVCDDGWDKNDANVVCKELGFGNAKAATPPGSNYAKGSGIIWLDSVRCIGFESSLTLCLHSGWGETNCDPDHNEDAWVICNNSTVKDLSNNFCRQVNSGSCADHQLCDSHTGVTCVDLDLYNQNGIEESVCMRCPDGYTGDGRVCRVVASSPPVFDQVPVNNVTAQFQRAFSIRCSSKPPVVYPSVWDWKKDGQPLSAEDIKNKRITSSAGRLLVQFAVAEDSGNYTCTLVNSAGSKESAGTEVIVNASPQIPGVISADAYMGGTAILACLVSSFPSSNITWRRFGKVLDSNNKFILISSNYSLQIKNVQFKDAGNYECEVANELGGAVANATLSVGLTIQFTEFPQKPKVVLSGEKVTLRCVVRAFPDPQTAWKKDGELVTKDDNHMITSSELIIKKAVRSDMGNYSCIAWNRGSVQAKSTLVLITGPPKIEIAPEDHYVLSGATVSFYCVGYGDPPPELTWKKSGESVKESDRVKIDKSMGELRITAAEVKDAGTYECTYSNKLGEDKKSAVLNVDGQAGVDPNTGGSKSSGLSKGALSGIIIAVVLIVVLVIAVIVYKCRKTSYHRGDRLVDKPARFSDLKSKLRRTTEVPYQEDID